MSQRLDESKESGCLYDDKMVSVENLRFWLLISLRFFHKLDPEVQSCHFSFDYRKACTVPVPFQPGETSSTILQMIGIAICKQFHEARKAGD